MKWFKFYGEEYIGDPKMFSLTPAERSCWITLLSYASQNEEGVIKHLTEDILMKQSGLTPLMGLDWQQEEWESTRGILERFEELGMIQIDNGTINITHWKDRQNTNLTGYERVKKYRAKKRNDNADDNAMITTDKKRVEENREEKNNTSSFKKPFYKNEEMRKVNGKWKVIPKDGGEWLEFAGNPKTDITWK